MSSVIFISLAVFCIFLMFKIEREYTPVFHIVETTDENGNKIKKEEEDSGKSMSYELKRTFLSIAISFAIVSALLNLNIL